jgi:outer membrane protein OmpA-like peptidoglycan-associated protein
VRRPAWRVPAVVAAVFLMAAFVPPAAHSQQKGGGFGTKDPGLFNLKGTIYFLPDGAEKMPDDLATMKPQGTIYTDRLDIPIRDFSEGFPGVTNRFEWFGLLYTGQVQIERAGDYTWRLSSDDGSRLWIDGQQVIDNDGQHGTDSAEGKVALARGVHEIKVWYFQGPATEISLQLFITPPGGQEKIFAMGDYAAGLAAAARKLDAQATPDGIRVRMDAAILFDTAKSDLKPEARDAIQALSQMIASYPNAQVRVVGFTDAVGDDAYNLKLSESRALSVKAALVAAGPPPGVRFETQGLGKARPVASNDTEAGRAKNRRVEVFIKP